MLLEDAKEDVRPELAEEVFEGILVQDLDGACVHFDKARLGAAGAGIPDDFLQQGLKWGDRLKVKIGHSWGNHVTVVYHDPDGDDEVDETLFPQGFFVKEIVSIESPPIEEARATLSAHYMSMGF